MSSKQTGYEHLNLSHFFGIDIRTLALLRISLGFYTLLDLFLRSFDLNTHYTDTGVFPTSALYNLFWYKGQWSLHALSGSATFQVILFLIAAIFAIMLMFGYKTRVAIIATWILTVSLQYRNPIVMGSWGDVQRVLLFWLMFLPSNATWSVDRYLQQDIKPPQKIFSAGSMALTLQICIIYWVTGVAKLHPIWAEHYTALEYVFRLKSYTTPLSEILANFPWLLKGLTFLSLNLEIFGPLLLFFPHGTAKWRMGIVLAFIAFHFGMLLTMRIGTFPLICIIAWFTLIPSRFWDEWLKQWLTFPLLKPFTHLNKLAEMSKPTLKRIFSSKKPGPIHLETPPWANVLACFLIFYISLWCLRVLDKDRFQFLLTKDSEIVARALHLDQQWQMFSPYPLIDDYWHVLEGTLKNGETVDLMTNIKGPISWEQPKRPFSLYKNARVRKFYTNLSKDNHKQFRPYLIAHKVSHWNASHSPEEHIQTLDFYQMIKTAPLNGPIPKNIETTKKLLFSYNAQSLN